MRLTQRGKVEDAHEDAVWTCVWTPEDTLVSGSVDESVKVWQPDDTADSIHTYTGHTLGVVSTAIHREGVYAASSSLDSFIRVWNLSEASTKAVMETPPGETWQIQFHPTAETLTVAAAGGSSSSMAFWNCDTAEKSQEFKLPRAEEKTKKDKFTMSIAFSPDGKRVACGSQDGSVFVYDCESGSLLHALEGHHKPVRSLTFTPDGKMVLTACDDMQAHLYDTESGSLIDTFSGHTSWVLSVACHPGGSTFATGSSDSQVKLWDLQSRTCAQTVSDHSDQVWSVAFSKEGSMLASVSDDKSVAFYSYAS